MANVTYFKNFAATSDPKIVSLDKAIQRIREGAIKAKVDKLRGITDEKEQKKFKSTQLPCILFSGEFSYRSDDNLIAHSGYAILDFDHVNIHEVKTELKNYSWIYSVFTSPSGTGVKAIARIPADQAKHRGYYLGIIQALSYLPGLDTTSKNISRICFESYDPAIYVNENATEFTGYIEENKPEPVQQTRTALVTDGTKLAICVNMVLSAVDGSKHDTLLKASRLAGGYISGGLIDETDAIIALEEAILTHRIHDFKSAQDTIRDGIRHGKENPIINPEVNLNDDDFSFISHDTEELDYIHAVRTGTLPQGLSTGFPHFDQYFRFKQGNFVIVNGHDNVGKSSFLWYLAVVSNVLHGWKWIIFSAENPEAQVRKNLIQFRFAKSLDKMNQVEYESGLRWAYENFTIIKADDLFTADQVLTVAQKVHNRSPHHALLIDPYNALNLDIENTKLSSHEYHYRVTSEMRTFCKKNNLCVYLNTHAVTEALRRLHKDGPFNGLQMAPNKADTEGGGKFSNRADDFITIHRHTAHETLYNITEVHIRKIKETETGGRPTPKDEPVTLRMDFVAKGFYHPETGFSPLTDAGMKQQRQAATVQRLALREEEPERDWRNLHSRDLGDEAPF